MAVTPAGAATSASHGAAVHTADWGRTQWAVLALCGMAYAAVCSELLVFVFIQQAVTSEFDLHAYAYPVLPLATTLTSMAAGPVWGALSDRLGAGRQRIFLAAAVAAAAGAVASAFAPSFAWLLVLRCAATVGGTGLTVVLFVLMAEVSPNGVRGRALVSLTTAGTFGVLYVAAAAWALSALADSGGMVLGVKSWRVLTTLAAVPVVVAAVIRCCVGVVHDAEATGYAPIGSPAQLESGHQPPSAESSVLSAGASSSPQPRTPASTRGRCASAFDTFVGMIHPRLRRRTVCLAVAWFCAEAAYWGTTMYLPEYLHMVHVSPHAVTFFMVAAELPGLAVAFRLVDTSGWGRLATLRWLALSAAVATALLAVGASLGVNELVVGASLAQYSTLIPTFAILFAVTPEVYPRSMRSSVMGVFNIVSSVPPLYSPFLSKFLLTGSEASWAYPLVWAGFLAVAALAVWAMPLRLEPQGLPLDQAGGGDGEPRATMLPGDKSSGNLKQLAPTVT